MRKTTFFLALAACLAAFCAEAAGGRHHRAHADPHPRGYKQRLQNAAADRLDLTRVKDVAELRRFIDSDLLVEIGSTDAYAIDSTLGEKDPDHRDLYRHARPYVKAFLEGEVVSWHAKFGTQYSIDSLTRTRAYQRMLCRSNGNAICGASGWRRSLHLTGAAVDIGRLGLSDDEDRYIRRRLDALQDQGKIIYILEGGSQVCYHIMVLPAYAEDDKAATVKRHKTRKKERHPKPPHRAKRHAGHGRRKARH